MAFSEKDLQDFNNRGISVETIENQLEQFRNGISFVQLYKAATIDDGIFSYSQREAERLIRLYDERKDDYDIQKFVPASGAASRMFKALFSAREILQKNEKLLDGSKEKEAVDQFIAGLDKFAFYNELLSYIENPEQELKKQNHLPFLNALLDENAMNYGAQPKAFLSFHQYEDQSRNAFEEQVRESLHYAKVEDDVLRIHFTISPEFEQTLKQEIERMTYVMDQDFNTELEITYSFQSPSTDTIAVDMNNEPFRKEDGSILFRPGGHGALLQNLNDLNGEMVFLKNIDNLVHESRIEDTIHNKKLLGGVLMEIVEKVHGNLEMLEDANFPDEDLEDMLDYAREKLAIEIPKYVEAFDKMEKIDYLYTLFNRPIRVCGMVKNEGEPGGGPFYVQDESGYLSMQIVEGSQMDLSDPKQADIQKNATHFNPVDLVLYIKDVNWDNFDLNDFVDPDAGFISEKSYAGRELKALELPGLWNGAMSDWITVFVEVPLSTFNPVKELNDLLRENHLEG
ncbi:MAG: DUF4301 family protein [Bacteroidales bacterium]|nr:DUF4301 family protein [Bacteroidales bacterium]